jgi:D-amino-acid dehydrogenase
MGCGSGRAIADIISGRQPEVEFAFTGMPKREPKPLQAPRVVTA